MNGSNIQVTAIHPERWGDDLDVVNSARVSFNKESSWESYEVVDDDFTEYQIKGVLAEKDAKLIKYLAKHKHFSPFNHSFITCRVKAPIFVARQLVKHRFMPWNEVSRRYVDDEPEFYVPHEYRLKADNVKQGSSDLTTELFVNPWGHKECKINDVHHQHIDAALTLYRSLLDQNICPEQARMVLPQNMMTEWIWSGTLGAYCDMLRLRLDPHTQYESRIVAQKIRDLILPVFPVSVSALLEVK